MFLSSISRDLGIPSPGSPCPNAVVSNIENKFSFSTDDIDWSVNGNTHFNELAGPRISLAQNYFHEAMASSKLEEAVKKCKKSFKILRKVQQDLGLNVALNQLVLKVKREFFFVQMVHAKDLYLTDLQARKEFYENIEDYRPYGDPQKIFNCFLDLVQAFQDEDYPSSYQLLTRAITHEVLDHPLLAAEAYLQLLDQQILSPPSCLKKVIKIIQKETRKQNDSFLDFLENLDRCLLVRLCEKTNNETLKKLLLQKDATRMCFEDYLKEFLKTKARREDPTCFVCFALERDVEDWLSKIFVPDLERVGVHPIFGPWHLSHADDLNSFQSRIQHTDIALVVCTPGLKKACTGRVKSITGCTQEVRIAQEKYNHEEKPIFIVPLNGKRSDSVLTPILEPTFAGGVEGIDTEMKSSDLKLKEVEEEKEDNFYNYYAKAFQIFTSLKEVENPAKTAKKLTKEFVRETKKRIFEEPLDQGRVKSWAEERYHPKFALKIEKEEKERDF